MIKKRIPRPNESRSGVYRTIILFRLHERAFFMFGFAKNERDNISTTDLRNFRDAAALLLSYSDKQLAVALESDILTGVNCDE